MYLRVPICDFSSTLVKWEFCYREISFRVLSKVSLCDCLRRRISRFCYLILNWRGRIIQEDYLFPIILQSNLSKVSLSLSLSQLEEFITFYSSSALLFIRYVHVLLVNDVNVIASEAPLSHKVSDIKQQRTSSWKLQHMFWRARGIALGKFVARYSKDPFGDTPSRERPELSWRNLGDRFRTKARVKLTLLDRGSLSAGRTLYVH